MRNGCSGFAGEGSDSDTTAELVTAALSDDDPCNTWNVIFTFVLGNRSVQLNNKPHAKHLTLLSKLTLTSAHMTKQSTKCT